MQVIITQPVIPHYRVALFAGLAAQADLDLRVVASPAFPGSPRSVPDLPGWADVSHRCHSIGGSLFWQSGIRLPERCGAGDVLVVAGNPRILSNLRLLAQARRRRMGTVWWSHWLSPTSVWWRAQLRQRQMRRADVLLLYTEDEVESMRKSGGATPLVMAAGNALATEEVDQLRQRWTASAVAGFRDQVRIGDHLLLFCGRLRRQPPTGLELALRALKQLTAEDSRYQLAVIGGGDDDLRLRDLARALGLGDRVRWLGELYDEAALAPWFLAARCLVYPGAIGLTLLHAFAYGLPVVTHGDRLSQNPEIAALIDGINGLLFARGNAEDLASKLRSICSQPELRNRLSAEALRTVHEDYSMPRMIARVRAAIDAASKRSLDR